MRLFAVLLGLMLASPALHAGDFKYVGAKSCKVCHKNKKYGDQWTKWLNGPHAKAFESLKTDKAKEAAAQLGIDDPTKSEKCLVCHTTGFGQGGYALDAKPAHNAKFEGVGCEACHGPGSAYKKLTVMKKISAGEYKPEDYGMVVPTEQTCLQCHATGKGCPFEKEFDFAKMYPQIAHPPPFFLWKPFSRWVPRSAPGPGTTGGSPVSAPPPGGRWPRGTAPGGPAPGRPRARPAPPPPCPPAPPGAPG